MKTLEAVNEILLYAGERQVRDITTPASLKALLCITDAAQEFSLLSTWPPFVKVISAPTWNGQVASFGEDVVQILGVYRDDCKLFFYQDNKQVNVADVYSIPEYNKVKVYTTDTNNYTFKVYTVPSIPVDPNLDINIPTLYLRAILRRALAEFTLRHLEDANTASQHTAEYELMVTQLRQKGAVNPNGTTNMYVDYRGSGRVQ